MQITAKNLTYYNGRQYQKGEKINVLPEDEALIGPRYGVKPEPEAKGRKASQAGASQAGPASKPDAGESA